MATFHYKARDFSGEAHQGDIESSDARTAVTLLRKKGLIVIDVSLKLQRQVFNLNKYFDKVGFRDIVVMTRQLSVMISAGLTLSESLDILEEQQSNKKLKEVLTRVSADVKGGLSFYQALSRHPDIFPKVYINLVRAGESSGKLDDVLIRMADSLEKEQEFRAKVKGAMIYPMVIISMMVIVVFIMMIFVIPKMTALYQTTALELPLPTRILIGTSNIFVNYWWMLIILSGISVYTLKRWMKKPEGKLIIHTLMLKMPVMGVLLTNVNLTNFTRTFALLITSGVSLLEAIRIVEDVTDNEVYKNAFKAAYSGVERGLSFSDQLNALPVFPKIVGQMSRVGEETGKVDEVFYKMSDYFETESDHMLKNLTVAIEPIVLIILGIGVAFLVISIILPIYKLTTAI